MNYYQYWFILKFEAIKKITNLPLYTGLHWHAFFEYELKVITDKKLSALDINVVPSGRQVERYVIGDDITVNIATNQKGKTVIEKWLELNHEKRNSNAHFVLDKTVSLSSYNILKFRPDLDFDFQQKTNLTLIFPNPLRLKRDNKDFGRFFDPLHFDFKEFIRKLAASLDLVVPDLTEVRVENRYFLWLDIKYSKTIGGIIGALAIKGNLSDRLLRLLHFGQFYGVGKNRSFGFGFYYIQENPNPIFKPTTYSDARLFYNKLSKKLGKQEREIESNDKKGSWNDPQNLKFLKEVCQNISSGEYSPQLLTEMQKQNKALLETKHIDFSLIYQLLADHLAELIENNIKKLLTFKDYLHKMNYNVHQTANQLQKEFDRGFRWGVKYQINSLFDAKILAKVKLALESLRVNQESINLVEMFFRDSFQDKRFLDIMLSNLIFLPLEQWVNRRRNLKLVRYMGTFVIIGRNISREKYIKPINFLLRTFELDFEIAKLGPRSEIEFLDYTISSSEG